MAYVHSTRDESHIDHQDVDEIENVVVDGPETRNANVVRLQEAIYLLFGVIEALIAIRFVLRALGANPAAPFSAAIYGITGPLVAPFNGVFGQPQLSESVFEPQSVLAVVAYALLGWLLAKIVWLLLADTGRSATTARTVTRTEQDHLRDHDLAA